MEFVSGNSYLIDYGNVKKPALFLRKEGDNNLFRDISGKFTLTDSYIASGKVTIEELQDV